MWRKIRWLVVAVIILWIVWRMANTYQTQSVTLPAATREESGTDQTGPNTSKLDREVDIVTLLPRDAIPAIFSPQFMSADVADEWYDDDEPVIGVEINGDARAYSIPFLSNHEIVNDTVGGRKIAVTW
jgi:hypothetical protein